MYKNTIDFFIATLLKPSYNANNLHIDSVLLLFIQPYVRYGSYLFPSNLNPFIFAFFLLDQLVLRAQHRVEVVMADILLHSWS